MRKFQVSHFLQAATSKSELLRIEKCLSYNMAMSVKVEIVLGALIENRVTALGSTATASSPAEVCGVCQLACMLIVTKVRPECARKAI
jgi:hypothetical protein